MRRATTGSYFRGHGGYPALERAYEHGFAGQCGKTRAAARGTRPWQIPILTIVFAGLVAAGCSSSSSGSSGSSSSPSSAAVKGTASVAYASSLQFLNEKVVAPAFTAATGYKFSGRGDASGALEADIAAGEISPNVFEAVGGDNITPLEPKFTKWYVQYAGTSMVVAYNPNSKYASQFKAIRGRLEAAVATCSRCCRRPASSSAAPTRTSTRRAATSSTCSSWPRCYCNLPSDTVSKILGTSDFGTANSPQIYAESALDSTLQSGQLDAVSAFVTQAIELHLPYITAAAADQPGQRRAGQPVREGDGYAQANGMTKHSGSPQVIDITIIGTPTPAGHGVREVHAVAGGPGPVQAGRVHGAHARRCSATAARCPQP